MRSPSASHDPAPVGDPNPAGAFLIRREVSPLSDRLITLRGIEAGDPTRTTGKGWDEDRRRCQEWANGTRSVGAVHHQGPKGPSSVAEGVGITDLGSVVTELKPQTLTLRPLVCGRERRPPLSNGRLTVVIIWKRQGSHEKRIVRSDDARYYPCHDQDRAIWLAPGNHQRDNIKRRLRGSY